jgi:hypothetical protein
MPYYEYQGKTYDIATTLVTGIVCKKCKTELPPMTMKQHLDGDFNQECPHTAKVKPCLWSVVAKLERATAREIATAYGADKHTINQALYASPSLFGIVGKKGKAPVWATLGVVMSDLAESSSDEECEDE